VWKQKHYASDLRIKIQISELATVPIIGNAHFRRSMAKCLTRSRRAAAAIQGCGPADEAHGGAVALDAEAIAFVFDLVEVLAGWDCRGSRRQAELKTLQHSPKIRAGSELRILAVVQGKGNCAVPSTCMPFKTLPYNLR
jgi:hypothetical protein